MKNERDPPADAAVVQRLSALKRRGGSILVVGALSAAHNDICELLLGESPDERILVRTDEIVQGNDHEDADRTTTVIERPIRTRSAADATATPPPSPRTLLEELRSTIRGRGSNSTVEVCFDSLRPFVSETDEQSLCAGLTSVGEAARETGTIVHFHLPATLEAVPTGLFETVDAVVEVTRREDGTYQRWHLPEWDHTTDWIVI
jgi:hypothetical protein